MGERVGIFPEVGGEERSKWAEGRSVIERINKIKNVEEIVTWLVDSR